MKVTKSMEDTCAAQQTVIINLLGKGSYGEVFLCQNNQRGLPSKIALKVIDTKNANKIYVDKFLKRECGILMDVKFKFIIHIYCMLHRRDKLYFFMRYAEQGDLLDYISKEGRAEEARAKLWAGQLASAIDYLHKNTIAHRDIKCENVLLTSSLNVMLTDFGFARKYDIVNGRPQFCTTYCGTKHYASPEILTCTPYDPEKSDVWAFGVVLYVTLNGTVPFPSTVTKKILELQQKGNVKMKVGLTASEDLMTVFKNVFEINPMKRWNTKRLLLAPWFRSGPIEGRPSISQPPRTPEVQNVENGSRNVSLLMAGEHEIFFWNEPLSFISGGEIMPSFMARSHESEGLRERMAEYRRRRGRKRSMKNI